MDYTTHRDGSTLTVKPRGSLNAVAAPELEAALDSLLEGVSEFIVDLSDLENISSMGLRLLLLIYRRMEKQGTMHVMNAHGNVADVLRTTGFSEIF